MKINCDLGERDDYWNHDQVLIPLVDQVNVSCGAHAGSEELILKTLSRSKELGKEIGIHPGYADKVNFGRVSLRISNERLQSSLIEQIRYFLKLCDSVGVLPSYLKPHGALYHDCQKEPVFDVLLKSMKSLNLDLPILLMETPVNLPEGIEIWQEAFLDRVYTSSNSLKSRSERGSVFRSSEAAIEQYLSIVNTSRIKTFMGEYFEIHPDSLCVHGDSPIALKLLQKINKYRGGTSYKS